MEELGLRGSKINLLCLCGYSLSEAITYVDTEDVEHQNTETVGSQLTNTLITTNIKTNN
jgi:hypothetical protein